ncbi:zinc-ribbon domain-containing protein [Clostridium sp.]|uniref:zinc-ribbon domain-containing protein n=1 Tax=Clostridium sp. TaxID=1506 RepID=UPI003D6D126E
MKFCHSCGLKVTTDEIFCSNCGTKLIKDSENTNETAHQSSNSFNTESSKIIGDILIKMLLRPVLGAKEFIEKGRKNSVIAVTLILAIIQGLLGIWQVNHFFSALDSMAIKFMQSFANLINKIDPTISLPNLNEIQDITNEMNRLKSFLSIPYGKIFLQNSLLFLIAILVIFIIVYLAINVLSKKTHEPFLVYKTALISLVPILYFEFFSTIISYLSVFLSLGVAAIGIVISLGCLSIILKEKLLIDENNSVFILSITFVLLGIIIMFCLQNFLASNTTDIITSIKNISDLVK